MRNFFVAAILAALLASAGSSADFELAYTGGPDSAALHGLKLGIDESNLQGEFLGVKLALTEVAGENVPAGAIAVFADMPGSIPEIASGAAGRAVFNLSDSSDELRFGCIANALHVIPSAKMKADAVAQWLANHPGSKVSAAAWHGKAVKFAARDLNRRYMELFGTPMDELAWSGWFAARAVGDTLMRDPSSDAGALLGALKEADGLDGQKGDPHSFRASGQLRQPLVLVDPSGDLLGEAPVRGAPGGLDSLGASPCE